MVRTSLGRLKARPVRRPVPRLEELERRDTPSGTVSLDPAGLLRVDCDDAPDVVRLDLDATRSTVLVTLNGATTLWDAAAVSAVRISTAGGGDVINLDRVGAGVTVDVLAGEGHDGITVGTPSAGLGALRGHVTVDGQGGWDWLYLDDSNSPFADTYQVSRDLVTTWNPGLPSLFGGVCYYRMENLVLDAGVAGNAINVDSTALETLTTIRGGEGDDTVTIARGVLDRIAGHLNIEGNGGVDRMFLEDGSNGFGDTYEVTRDLVSSSNPSAPPLFAGVCYYTLEGLTLNAGWAGNVINVRSTGPGTDTTINAGDGDDVVNVGGADGLLDYTFGGSLAVNGQGGADRLNVNAQNNTLGA